MGVGQWLQELRGRLDSQLVGVGLSFPVFCFIDFLRSGSKHLASKSTYRGASCSYAAMGARENFDSVSRVESAH